MSHTFGIKPYQRMQEVDKEREHGLSSSPCLLMCVFLSDQPPKGNWSTANDTFLVTNFPLAWTV